MVVQETSMHQEVSVWMGSTYTSGTDISKVESQETSPADATSPDAFRRFALPVTGVWVAGVLSTFCCSFSNHVSENDEPALFTRNVTCGTFAH